MDSTEQLLLDGDGNPVTQDRNVVDAMGQPLDVLHVAEIRLGQLRLSVDHQEVLDALGRANRKVGVAAKDTENPFFRSTYASLPSVHEAVFPAWAEEELTWFHAAGTPVPHGDIRAQVVKDRVEIVGIFLVTVSTFVRHLPTKQWAGLDLGFWINRGDPQAAGSVHTYGRRYGINLLSAVGTDDDDGNGAYDQKPAGGVGGGGRKVMPLRQGKVDALHQLAAQLVGPDRATELLATIQERFEVGSVAQLDYRDEARFRSAMEEEAKFYPQRPEPPPKRPRHEAPAAPPVAKPAPPADDDPFR